MSTNPSVFNTFSTNPRMNSGVTASTLVIPFPSSSPSSMSISSSAPRPYCFFPFWLNFPFFLAPIVAAPSILLETFPTPPEPMSIAETPFPLFTCNALYVL